MRDASTGENLAGATVYLKELGQAASTNVNGFYSITVPKGLYTVIYSYVGFTEVSKFMDLYKDTSIVMELKSNTTLNAVEVKASRKDENIKSSEMGTITLSMEIS